LLSSSVGRWAPLPLRLIVGLTEIVGGLCVLVGALVPR
jgi:hypothetical protein